MIATSTYFFISPNTYINLKKILSTQLPPNKDSSVMSKLKTESNHNQRLAQIFFFWWCHQTIKGEGYLITQKLLVGSFQGHVVGVIWESIIDCFKLPRSFGTEVQSFHLRPKRCVAKNCEWVFFSSNSKNWKNF